MKVIRVLVYEADTNYLTDILSHSLPDGVKVFGIGPQKKIHVYTLPGRYKFFWFLQIFFRHLFK